MAGNIITSAETTTPESSVIMPTSAAATPPATRQASDAREWCLALQGASETIGAASTQVGAMVGGRGCVQRIVDGFYMVTVAWQGLAPISAPPVQGACGFGAYNGGTGSARVHDRCRRAVTTLVIIPNLT